MADQLEDIFMRFIKSYENMKIEMDHLKEHIQQLELGGGGGNAVVADYVPGTTYHHNNLVVDTATDDLYLVICDTEYVAIDIGTDRANSNIRLINNGIGNFVLFDHDPTNAEIQQLDENEVVVVYSASDDPFVPSE